MRIDILCLFPDMFTSPFEQSIIKRAKESNLLNIVTHNIRDYTHDSHHTVDDYPYGGGPGMILKPEPIFELAETIQHGVDTDDMPIVLLTPQGKLLTQKIIRDLALQPHLILICGHYEGIDERVHEHLATDEISIGDYVLSGGELAAMVMVDAITRLIPGVLGSEESAKDDSHSNGLNGLLEYPQYTRPATYRSWSVPPILLSGNHEKIAQWRKRQSILRTATRRPEMLQQVILSCEEKSWISERSLNQN